MIKKNENEIILMAKTDEVALEIIINKYKPLLLNVASRFSLDGLMGITLDDLITEGVLGLVKAIERFDPKKGKFSTYARKWIHGEMSDLVTVLGNSIPIKNRRDRKIKRAQDYYAVHGVLPKGYEDISEQELNKVLPRVVPVGLPNQQYDEGYSRKMEDMLFVEEGFEEEVISEIDTKNEFSKVYAVMKTVLTPMELKVVLAINGFNGQNRPMTASEVGEKMGYSGEWIRRTNINATNKIKERLGISL